MSTIAKDKDKKNALSFYSWFGAGLGEEVSETSHAPYLWDDDKVKDDQIGRRHYQKQSRTGMISKDTISAPTRKISLGSQRSGASGPGHLIRISCRNETTVLSPPKKRDYPSMPNEFETQSMQSSITNSWAPRLKHYPPAPYKPYPPIENMVITVQKPENDLYPKVQRTKSISDTSTTTSTVLSSVNSGIMISSLRKIKPEVEVLHKVQEADEDANTAPDTSLQSLILSDEQMQEIVDKEIQEDDVNLRNRTRNDTSPLKNNAALDLSAKPSVLRGWVADDILPNSSPPLIISETSVETNKTSSLRLASQSIEDAIKELKALPGMQVKCLDEIVDVEVQKENKTSKDVLKLIPHSHPTFDFKDDDNKAYKSNQLGQTTHETPEESNITGWIFGGSSRRAIESNVEDSDANQAYALIQSDMDEERMKKYFEEEAQRKEEEMRAELERKKKKASWFFFRTEEHEDNETVLDGAKISDAIDDLEFLAGDTRVSQVKESRLSDHEGVSSSRFEKEKNETHPPIQGLSLFRSQGVLSPSVAVPNFLSEKQKRSLSKFQLPLEKADEVSANVDSGVQSERPLHIMSTVNALRRVSIFTLQDSIDSKEIKSQSLPQEEASLELQRSMHDSSIRIPTDSSAVKKEALISNNLKRNARWRLNQSSMNSIFKEYFPAFADIDPLLPSHDEFDTFENAEESIETQFHEIRDKMLEDGNLSEREIAAFFGGMMMLSMKVRSLQSQLTTIKAVQRAESDERKIWNLSPEYLLQEDILKEAPRILLIRSLQNSTSLNSETKSLLRQLEVNERKRIKLEREMVERDFSLPEIMPFDDAMGGLESVSKKIEQLRSNDNQCTSTEKASKRNEELANLESTLLKYKPSLDANIKWMKAEERWESENAKDNDAALKRILRHMPIHIKELSEDQLAIEKTPNGKLLPRRIAKKFKRTTILQLLREDPQSLYHIHPSILENLQTTGLTLTEKRAIYAHLRDVGLRWRSMYDDNNFSRKWQWFRMFKQDFKESLLLYERHCEEFGPPDNHPYLSRSNPTIGCPYLGKQCPVKAEKMFDYGVDFGFPDYIQSSNSHNDVANENMKTRVTNTKKALDRMESLQRHYKARDLEVALAIESCASMDNMMDRMESLKESWIETRVRLVNAHANDMQKRIEIGSFSKAVHELSLTLTHLTERSGMQLTASKDANTSLPDSRSSIELGLCEEVWEHAEDFFSDIEFRLRELDTNDSELKAEINELRDLLDELHNRNMATIHELGVRYPEPSRTLMKRKDIERRVRENTARESIGDAFQDFKQQIKPSNTPLAVRKISGDDEIAVDHTSAFISSNDEKPCSEYEFEMPKSPDMNITSAHYKHRIKNEDVTEVKHHSDQNVEKPQHLSTRNDDNVLSVGLEETIMDASHTDKNFPPKHRHAPQHLSWNVHKVDVSEQRITSKITSDLKFEQPPSPEKKHSEFADKKSKPKGRMERIEVPLSSSSSSLLDNGQPSIDEKLSNTRARIEALRAKSLQLRTSTKAHPNPTNVRDDVGSIIGRSGKVSPIAEDTDLSGKCNHLMEGSSPITCKMVIRPNLDANETLILNEDTSQTRSLPEREIKASNSDEKCADPAIAEGNSRNGKRSSEKSSVTSSNYISEKREINVADPSDKGFSGRVMKENITIREKFILGKSPLRERITVGKSPARERLAAKSPARERTANIEESVNRLASIEARREQMRISMAERKKAREEAAKSIQLKET